MVSIKEINIKNRSYYFFDDMINNENFNPDLLKMGRKSQKYLYLLHRIYHNKKLEGGFIEEKNGNKYLNLASTNKEKVVLKRYTKLWKRLKVLLKK